MVLPAPPTSRPLNLPFLGALGVLVVSKNLRILLDTAPWLGRLASWSDDNVSLCLSFASSRLCVNEPHRIDSPGNHLAPHCSA